MGIPSMSLLVVLEVCIREVPCLHRKTTDGRLSSLGGPVPVWYPVAAGRRAWMAPSGSHWDRRIGDRHLRFLNVSLQHHHAWST